MELGLWMLDKRNNHDPPPNQKSEIDNESDIENDQKNNSSEYDEYIEPLPLYDLWF